MTKIGMNLKNIKLYKKFAGVQQAEMNKNCATFALSVIDRNILLQLFDKFTNFKIELLKHCN